MLEKLVIYKQIGETPLEALERVRLEQGISADVPMTYAGRLDPLVEGLMIVLVGEACKTKDQYTKLGKTYEFEILSGFSTDTYDLLGLVTATNTESRIKVAEVEEYLKQQTKTIVQKYPPYSSKTVDGKQLHQHAREGNTPVVEHEVSLFDFTSLEERTLSGKEVLETIQERVELVHGDFRQQEIIQKWTEVLDPSKEISFQITKWRVAVSGGFYIRQLVHDIGQQFAMPTVTFHIKRTQIGSFTETSL
jgi:tRNA pseudouridine(55) synthase